MTLAIGAGAAQAEGAFPAPLPRQQEQVGTVNDPAFPPVDGSAPGATTGAPRVSPFPAGGAAPVAAGGFSAGPTIQPGAPSQDCMKEFRPLRDDAEQRGKLIKAAGERHAAPDEACKLIKNFAQAEVKMLSYIEKNSATCWIPSQVADQLRNGQKNSKARLTGVCTIAQQLQQRGPAGRYDDRMVLPVGDFPPYDGLTPR